jgi:YHS domain-containing protein
MILTPLLLVFNQLVCPVMGTPAKATGAVTDLGGIRYAYCCPGCKETFEKAPAKHLAAAQKRGKPFGTSLFDPVAKVRTAKPVAHSDWQGVRYVFAQKANKAKFEKTPGQYAKAPAKEALFCPVNKAKVASYAAASGYADHAGVRYYFCCAGCDKPFKAAPAKYAKNAAAHVRPVGMAPAKEKAPGKNDYATTAKVGKYQVELRVPEEGVFAGETIDIEFRLSDTTQDDAIEGKKGVPNAAPTATVTMPSMPGMPVAKPPIHTEGVPGDYGIELFFPHGGDYRIDLKVTPPGEKPLAVAFTVSVKDAEAKKGTATAKPYKVELLHLTEDAKAGEPLRLHLAIKDGKTGEVVKEFDEAHTKLFHLIVVSKDLGWFIHEHPEQQADGTFTLDWTFPAGGDYLVFADVAPKDKGSQVISTPLHLKGPSATWGKKLIPTKGPQNDGGIVADFIPLEKKIPVGRTTVLSFKLRDEKTGKPITDLEPYLDAQGHLMIIHQDGGTFVHSHPAEDKEAEALAKKGDVRFTARFPRPGTYKAWAQFQRGGKISTIAFVFKVE